MAGKFKLFTKRIWSKLISYFLQGLFLFSPVALTVYCIVEAFKWIDSRLIIEVPGIGAIPGTGIAALLVIILLIGFLGSTLVFEGVWRLFENFLNKFPLTKFLYPALKDIFSALMGKEKKFNKPVLFRISKDSDLERIGFITSKDLSSLGIEGNKVAIYCPISYNLSGHLYIVPAENVKDLPIKASEAMKFVLAGGMVKVKESDKEKDEKQD